MRRKIGKLLVAGILVCLSAGVAHAGNFRFPVGLAYVSGYNDIKNRYENNLDAEGYLAVSTGGVPIGMMFQPYYQFDSGLGVGVGLGPLMVIMGDRDFYDLPVAVDARYYILPDANISPYVRAGIKKHLASGSYVNSSTVGVFGGAGVEFFRKKRVGLGVEVLFDNSSIEFETKNFEMNPNTFGWATQTGKEEIKPSKFLVSISAIF